MWKQEKSNPVRAFWMILACIAIWHGVTSIEVSSTDDVYGQEVTAQSVSPFLSADTWTLLFEDFEGAPSTWQSETFAASVNTQPGYISGNAMFLSDTGAFAVFSDSWWQPNGQGFQDSGTIELFYRPETFIFNTPKSNGMLVTQGERPGNPAVGGLPQLSVFEDGSLRWEISDVPGYVQTFADGGELDPNPYEKLNPGQWYHIAATWDEDEISLFINDTLMDTASADSTVVFADTFLIGATGILPGAFGLAARGRIDKFRLSSIARQQGAFPQALGVQIDTPSGVTVAKPFFVSYRTFISDSRPVTVELYADTDESGLNGTLLASGLSSSGTVAVGSGLSDTTWFLYAIAQAGTDTAFFYIGEKITVTSHSNINPAIVSETESGCLLTRMRILPESAFTILRGIREALLASKTGRRLVSTYYSW